jgi:SAM-dependent methyltransferase
MAIKGSAERQAALWGARSEDWAEVQEGMMNPLYREILQRCSVGKGVRLLDAGCGAGGFLVLAKERGADVVGIDATPELLDIARGRLPGVDLRQGDIEDLLYEDEVFELVTGFNSFQYASDPVRALSEARRVVRPGGLVVLATWGKPENCDAAGHLKALAPLLPPPPPGAGGPFALSDENVLREVVTRAGLTAVEVGEVSCPWEYPSEAVALRGMLSAGPVALAMRTSGEQRVRAAVLDAILPYRTGSGGYRLENEFRYVSAQR